MLADRLDEHGVGAALLRLTDADASNRIVPGGRLGDAGDGADVGSAEQLVRTRQSASTVADDRTLRRVLDELRRGGRTVGVISHLEELRTRIPTRLEVVAGRHGSRLAG